MRVTCLLLLCTIGISLSACGGSGGGVSNTPPPVVRPGGVLGVTFSVPIGGVSTIYDNHVSGNTIVTGGMNVPIPEKKVTQIFWNYPSSTGAVLTYSEVDDWILMSFNISRQIVCGVTKVYNAYPACSTVGVTFDRSAGSIAFKNSPLLIPDITPTDQTVTGILHFTPFANF